jgi:SAM-dependent methyltransferase
MAREAVMNGTGDTPHVDTAAKRRVAALYTRVAADYGEGGPPFFAHAGRRLIDLAGVEPGDRLLDVATGRGAALFPAAERVGPTGRVVGVDLAAGMVERTRDEIARRGLENAAVLRMDAESLAFRQSVFDRVVCSFAVFFFPDVPRVLSEIGRVLRPGGTVAFAFARGTGLRWRWYGDLLREFGAFDGLPPPVGDTAIRNEGALVAALKAAGFPSAHEVVEETEFFIPDETAWWSSLWTHGERVPLERLDGDALARLRDACFRHLQTMKEPSGIPVRQTHVYVLAAR